jgi:hypothetical protein
MIGWLLLAIGLVGAVDNLLGRYLAYVLLVEPNSGLPSLRAAASLAASFWLVVATCTLMLLFLFPNGTILSRQIQVAALLIPLLVIAALCVRAIQPGPLPPPFEGVENALGVAGAGRLNGLAELLIGGIAVVGLIGAVDMFRRYRLSTSDERQQFEWFAYVAAWLPVLILLQLMVAALAPEAVDVMLLLTPLYLVVIPFAIGLAVLKYRLYDIDILINRTLVYVPLTAILAGVYVALTGLVRTLFTELTQAGSDAAIAISTLGVVALLTPLKNQLQTLVDRYFKEDRKPAIEVKRLTEQARSVLQVVDTEEFVQSFLENLTTALKSEGSAIELRNGVAPLRITSGTWRGQATLSVPLCRNGHDFGSLAIGPRIGGRAYDELEQDALKDSADVLSHALSLRRWPGA